jgi:antitoxin MazE
MEAIVYHVHVAKWGNSLGFRIPSGIADSMHIRAGDTLELAPAKGGLLLKKTLPQSKHYALKNILDSFVSSTEHPEIDFGEKQGDEAW